MIKRLSGTSEKLSEKTRMLIYIVAACVVFLFSVLIPLAFRGDGPADPYFITGERAAMFAKYNAKDAEIKYKVVKEPEKSMLKFCDSRFDQICSVAIIDSNVRKVITAGEEYINLSDGEKSMTICHMWLQDEGDWTNWIDVYMDAETGFVYYIYISGVCVNNFENYVNAIEEEFNAKTIASTIAKETQFDLKLVNWSGKAEDTAMAYTSSDGSAIVWNIYCSYYPGSLLDVKISVS